MENEVLVNGKKEKREAVTGQIYQQPNSNILGYRLRLHLFNMAKVNPDSTYHAWLDKHPKNERFLTHLLSSKQVDLLGTSFFVSCWFRSIICLVEIPFL